MDKKEKMFLQDEARYMTSGINETVPTEIQIILWSMIDEIREKVELDYLQIFELQTTADELGNKILKIKHSQEQPEYEKIFTISCEGITELNGIIFVIDDITHATMLWANEY